MNMAITLVDMTFNGWKPSELKSAQDSASGMMVAVVRLDWNAMVVESTINEDEATNSH